MIKIPTLQFSASQPHQPETRANELANEMREDILERSLRSGEVYMTEAEVAQRYSVSRSIAREAVSRLRGLGILTSRQGKGLIVASPCPVELLTKSLPFLSHNENSHPQLAQLRYSLEVGSIDLAVTHATREMIEQLSRLADDFSQAREHGAGAEAESDIELKFHGLILRMTGNDLIAGMHGVLDQFFQQPYVHTYSSDPADPAAVWQHRAIAEAIRQRDVEQSRTLIRQHLRPLLGTGEPASST